MLVAAIGTRLVSGAEAIVDMPPVIRRGVGRIDAERLDGVDRREHTLDLGPAADAQQDLAAGTDEGQRLIGLARRDRAHDVDARDDGAVSRSRPSGRRRKCVFGAKLSTRRRRSMIVSPTSRPNLIQCSTRFSSQVSSTAVRASGEQGAACVKAGLPSCLSSIDCGEFAGEQVAQHVCDGLAALEGRDLDPAPQLRRHVDGEPRGVEIAGAGRRSRRLGRADPAYRDRPAERRSGDWTGARSSHHPIDFRGQRGDLARGVTCGVDVEDEAAGARGVREGDALADTRGKHRRIVISEAVGGLAGDHGARGAAVEHEARDKLRAEDARFLRAA